jgi:aspartyl-tRNA(Asn)/glutamyl-tRNA(Gln) amidotransferase subunit C
LLVGLKYLLHRITDESAQHLGARLLQSIASMAKLTRDDVLKLARLARLDLNDDEIVSLTTELSAILQYVEQLQNVDVDGLKPTNQVTGLVNVYRDDIVKGYGYEPTELMKNLPEQLDNLIKVKRMLG